MEIKNKIRTSFKSLVQRKQEHGGWKEPQDGDNFYKKHCLPVMTWNKKHLSKQVIPIKYTLEKSLFAVAMLLKVCKSFLLRKSKITCSVLRFVWVQQRSLFLIKISVRSPASLLKRRLQHLSVFLWILLNFQGRLFCKTSASNCFWILVQRDRWNAVHFLVKLIKLKSTHF